MTTLKIGDKVRVTPGATARAGRFVGRAVIVASIHGVGVMAKDPDGGVFGLYHSEYELIPTASTLALGVRVKTTQDSRPSWLRGKEGVVTDWGEDAEPDARYVPVVIDCDPDDVWYYEADELEALPEPRKPQAGEVWGCRGVFVGILTDTGGLLRSVNLETNRLYSADPLEPKHLLDLGFTYAAASVTEAVKKGLL